MTYYHSIRWLHYLMHVFCLRACCVSLCVGVRALRVFARLSLAPASVICCLCRSAWHGLCVCVCVLLCYYVMLLFDLYFQVLGSLESSFTRVRVCLFVD